VQATYLAWLDCSRLGLDEPAGVFERLGRVALEPGPLYGTGGDGFARLNFATSLAILDEAIQRMRAAIPPTAERSQDRRFHRTGRG
jgi:cystathionine beta-lyase